MSGAGFITHIPLAVSVQRIPLAAKSVSGLAVLIISIGADGLAEFSLFMPNNGWFKGEVLRLNL